jgi:hypothetical protein
MDQESLKLGKNKTEEILRIVIIALIILILSSVFALTVAVLFDVIEQGPQISK